MNVLDSVFFEPFLPHVLDCHVFIQTTKNDRFSLYPFLTFFSARVLETHLGGKRQPVLVLPYPNFVQVLGMEQPTCPLGPLLFRDILFSAVSFPLALEADN